MKHPFAPTRIIKSSSRLHSESSLLINLCSMKLVGTYGQDSTLGLRRLMACDVTRVFLALVRALETTNEAESHPHHPVSPTHKTRDNAFSFHKRATSLHTSLETLSGYLRRVQQLTGTTVGNNAKQKLHSDLMDQVTSLMDQCSALLIQLKEISPIDESTGKRLDHNQEQIAQHRHVVLDYLEDRLTKIRQLRDAEADRQRHLSELTGTLASGVRSVSSLRTNPLVKSTDSVKRRNSRGHTLMSLTEVTTTEDSHMTESELQTFERENRSMYEHLTEQQDDLHLVARAIHEIGKLNLTLSTHLSEQLETAQQIGSQFVNSTENIRQGNDLLRSALSSKASAQFWILFTVIVLTFSLHFLDWYYQ